MKHLLLAIALLAAQGTSAQIPAEKVLPPASFFKQEYGKEGVDPMSLEYLNGKELKFGEQVVTISTYFEGGLDNFFEVSFHRDQEVIGKMFRQSHSEFRNKREDSTSEIQESEHGRFFMVRLNKEDPRDDKVLVAHWAVIHNVLFHLSGYEDDKEFKKWVESYSEYLTKSYIEEPIEYRDWEGANGKVIKGYVHSVDRHKQTIKFETEDGKVYPELSLSKFSEESRKEILESL